MNNQELINWLEKIKLDYENISDNLNEFDYFKGLMDGAKIAIYSVLKNIKEDLKQLDEPKKIVVPSIIEKFIRKHEDPIFEICAWADYFGNDGRTCDDSELSAVIKWYGKNRNEFYQAVVNGYEVEKEQLYYVFEPTTKQYLGVDKVSTEAFWLSSQNSGARTPLTEQEIKSIDESYWDFAEKVWENK